MKLEQRKDSPEGYYYATIRGRKWSVVDFGTIFKKVPTVEDLREAGVFLGWEAMLLEDEKLNSDEMYRADSWEELEKQL